MEHRLLDEVVTRNVTYVSLFVTTTANVFREG
jgi:hypothetical protein